MRNFLKNQLKLLFSSRGVVINSFKNNYLKTFFFRICGFRLYFFLLIFRFLFQMLFSSSDKLFKWFFFKAAV